MTLETLDQAIRKITTEDTDPPARQKEWPLTPKHFLTIAMTARTGSSALCSLLVATGVFRHVGEFFNPRGPLQTYSKRLHAKNWNEYWDRVKRCFAGPNGHFACKTTWSDFAPFTDGTCAESLMPKARYVYLDRRDLVSQTLSFYRAVKTRHWHQEFDRPRAVSPVSTDLDIETALSMMQKIQHEKNEWTIFFAKQGVHPLVIYYEDMISDVTSSVRLITDFCEAPGARDVTWADCRLERIAKRLDPATEQLRNAGLSLGLLTNPD